MLPLTSPDFMPWLQRKPDGLYDNKGLTRDFAPGGAMAGEEGALSPGSEFMALPLPGQGSFNTFWMDLS